MTSLPRPYSAGLSFNQHRKPHVKSRPSTALKNGATRSAGKAAKASPHPPEKTIGKRKPPRMWLVDKPRQVITVQEPMIFRSPRISHAHNHPIVVTEPNPFYTKDSTTSKSKKAATVELHRDSLYTLDLMKIKDMGPNKGDCDPHSSTTQTIDSDENQPQETTLPKQQTVVKWLYSFEEEQVQFQSLALLCEARFDEAEVLTSGWPVPNKLRMATALGCLHKLNKIHAGFSTVLEKITNELGRSIIENYDQIELQGNLGTGDRMVKYYAEGNAFFEKNVLSRSRVEQLEVELMKLREENAAQQSMLEELKFHESTKQTAPKERKLERGMSSRRRLLSSHGVFQEDRLSCPRNSLRPSPAFDRILTDTAQVDQEEEEREITDFDVVQYFVDQEEHENHLLLQDILENPSAFADADEALLHIIEGLGGEQRSSFISKFVRILTKDDREIIEQSSSGKSEKLQMEFLNRLKTKLHVDEDSEEEEEDGEDLDSDDVQIIRDKLEATKVKILDRVSSVVSEIEELSTRVIAAQASVGRRCSSVMSEKLENQISEVISGETIEPRAMLKPNDLMHLVECTIDEQEGGNSSASQPARRSTKQKRVTQATLSTRVKKKTIKGRTIALSDLCSMLSAILIEKHSQDCSDRSSGNSVEPLSGFVKHYFIRTYGLKSLALSYLSGFEEFVQKYSQKNLRLKLYCSFLGYDPNTTHVADQGLSFFYLLLRNILRACGGIHTNADILTLASWKEYIGDGVGVKTKKPRDLTAVRISEIVRNIPCFIRKGCTPRSANAYAELCTTLGTTVTVDELILAVMDVWFNEAKELKKHYAQLFVEADRNSDGQMDYHEFLEFAKECELNVNDERSLVALYDEWSGDDDVIDEGEFTSYMLAIKLDDLNTKMRSM